MGKGKGSPEAWVAVIKPGRLLFEMEGVDEPTAREAMRLAAHKLPVQDEVCHACEHDLRFGLIPEERE